MKKALFLLVLPFAAMIAVKLTDVPLRKVADPSNAPSITIPDEVMLYEDEGDWSGGWSVPVYRTGDRVAVNLTPTGYPFELQQVGYVPIQWSLNDAWDTPGDIVIFATDAQGHPTTELGRKTIKPSRTFDMEWFDVSELDITISSGSFICALEAKEDSPDPENIPGYPATASDFLLPVHHKSWWCVDGTWYPFENVYGDQSETWVIGDSIDLIIRAKGDAGSGIVELQPTGVTGVTTSTIVADGSTIHFTLASAENVEITLWDALGRPVQTLYRGNAEAGEHSLSWNGSSLPAGTYFIRLKTPADLKMAKIVLLD